MACRTQISIFTSKTFTRFYVTTAVFTISWTGHFTTLTVKGSVWTSYRRNDYMYLHVADIDEICFKHFQHKICTAKGHWIKFYLLFSTSLKRFMTSFIAWSSTVYMKKLNQVHMNIKTGSWMNTLHFFFAFVYSFPYAILNYFYCVLITRVC